MKLKLFGEDAKVPLRAHPEDAGYDLFAVERTTIYPNQTKAIRTGVAIELPPSVAGLVVPRSGLALKFSLTVVNSPGLIDPGFIGEIKVIMHNLCDSSTYYVNPG